VSNDMLGLCLIWLPDGRSTHRRHSSCSNRRPAGCRYRSGSECRETCKPGTPQPSLRARPPEFGMYWPMVVWQECIAIEEAVRVALRVWVSQFASCHDSFAVFFKCCRRSFLLPPGQSSFIRTSVHPTKFASCGFSTFSLIGTHRRSAEISEMRLSRSSIPTA
jgi:hypothetical protein